MKKKLAKNTIASLLFQITSVTCGFILPRLILESYGTNINGLVNSITQFLTVIAFLELGVGAVVQSSLYKPLADKDNAAISKIIVSANKFFRNLARILLVYIIFLMISYTFITNTDYDWQYTALLIGAIGISSFAQYYFGMVDRLLLTADQRGYIQYNAQTVTLILNTLASVVLIKVGASIHMVKLVTSLIYLMRPVFLRYYVNKYYAVDRRITYEGEPIKQKWNGMAQHLAAVVLDSTDNIVLSVFATLADVSIYSVYHIVLYGVKNLCLSMTNGIQAVFGRFWAEQRLEELHRFFGTIEWIIHNGTVFVFGCTGVLVVPFVQVYTLGINDANYVQPLFGCVLTLAHAGHCLRLPYNMMILAGGHYKETQHNYVIAVLLNIVISVLSVRAWGLIGVALGTMAAMAYQTVWMAYYNSKNLLKWPFQKFLKQVIVDIIVVLTGVFLTKGMSMGAVTYLSWTFLAVKVAVVWVIVLVVYNCIFYRENVVVIKNKLLKR